MERKAITTKKSAFLKNRHFGGEAYTLCYYFLSFFLLLARFPLFAVDEGPL
jgi:hypothetical protein